jgi:hypothetical protein
MQAYNNIATTIFDFLLTPFGHEFFYFDLVLWPVLMGVVALQVYKYTSNQKAIIAVKKQISMHLLEIRLFRDDLIQVLKSTVTIVAKNFIYVGHNLVPLVVMLAPMVAIMVQLVANYAYEPSSRGSVELLHLKLDPAAAVSSKDVTIALPKGVVLDAPAVRTADGQVFWRVRADEAGDHVFKIDVAGQVLEKGWAVGGEPRKIPVKRLRNWEALLYPGEEAIPSGAPVLSVELATNVRALAYMPDGEGGILIWTLVLSLLAGVALKDSFGVTL